MTHYTEKTQNCLDLLGHRYSWGSPVVHTYKTAIENPNGAGEKLNPNPLYRFFEIEKEGAADTRNSGFHIDQTMITTLIIGPQIYNLSNEELGQVTGLEPGKAFDSLVQMKDDFVKLKNDKSEKLSGYTNPIIVIAGYLMMQETDSSLKKLSDKKASKEDAKIVSQFAKIANGLNDSWTFRDTKTAFNQRAANIERVSKQPWNKNHFKNVL